MNRHVYFRQQEKNVLCHHGIKGQKWGVRRFQNPDGSYTQAGKERYSNAKTKQLSLTDFKNDYGVLEYLGEGTGLNNKELVIISDIERLKSKYGETENKVIERINQVRNDKKILDNAKQFALDDLMKYGGWGEIPNLKYSGLDYNRDNDIELIYGVYSTDDNGKEQWYGDAWVTLHDYKKPAYSVYND